MKRDYRVTLLYLGLACMILSSVLACGLMAGSFLGVMFNFVVLTILFVTSIVSGIASIILPVIEFTMTDTVLTSQIVRLICYPIIFLCTICIYNQLFELL